MRHNALFCTIHTNQIKKILFYVDLENERKQEKTRVNKRNKEIKRACKGIYEKIQLLLLTLRRENGSIIRR
jgi:hypothetical protein